MIAFKTLLLLACAGAMVDTQPAAVPIADANFTAALVLIEERRTFVCAGAILTSRHVITAAYGIKKHASAKNLYAVVGTNQWENGGYQYLAHRVTIHPNFRESYTFPSGAQTIMDRKNDLAIVETEEMQLVGFVDKVYMPDNSVPDNADVIAYGWGEQLVPEGQVRAELYALPARVNEMENCIMNVIDASIHYDKEVPTVYRRTNLCTLGTGDFSMCYSNTGAPLVTADSHELVGLASWAPGCQDGYPDIYVNITNYKQWINENTALN